MKWIAGLGTGALLVSLAACGGSSGGSGSDSGDDFADGSAKDISAEAVKDMKSAKSLRMAGSVTNEGETFDLDVAITTDGDCEGTIKLAGQGSAEILTAGGDSYFRPDAQFWESFAGPQAKQITKMVGDKWVIMPAQDSGFNELCDLDNFLEELEDPTDDAEVSNEGTEEVDGQEAVVLSGKTEDDEPIKAFVSTDDPHYILKIEVSGGDEPGTLAFSDFDEVGTIEAPDKSEVADLNMAG